MRRVFYWLILIAILWSAYWGIAAWALRAGFVSWFSERAREGWHAEYKDITSAGYPANHLTTISDPVLADPGTGTAWSADWIAFESASVSPTQQQVRFPNTPQRFSYFDKTLILSAETLRAGLGLTPGRSLELEQLNLLSGPWEISSGSQPVMSGQAVMARMEQSDMPLTYRLTGDIPDLTLLGPMRAALTATQGLPDRFSALDLRMLVTFDTAWDRRALELRRPQPRHIDLLETRAQWGPMHLRASGTLDIDEVGRPQGEITLQAADWKRMLTLAQDAGLLPGTLRDNMEQVLTLLAGRGGGTDRLELRLTFDRGRMKLGPLPLGPAPRLLLR